MLELGSGDVALESVVDFDVVDDVSEELTTIMVAAELSV